MESTLHLMRDCGYAKSVWDRECLNFNCHSRCGSLEDAFGVSYFKNGGASGIGHNCKHDKYEQLEMISFSIYFFNLRSLEFKFRSLYDILIVICVRFVSLTRMVVPNFSVLNL